MSLNTTGFVLRPPRTAPANATTTGEVTNGVSRDHKALPGSYAFAVPFAETSADQYRAAVLQNPQEPSEEYLVWAASSSNITLLEDVAWAETAENPAGTVSIPEGSLTVIDGIGFQTDGTSTLVVRDTGGRSLYQTRLITVTRGDTGAEVEAGPDAVGGPTYDFTSQDADAGLVSLSSAALVALGGGVSTLRGDSISVVTYIVAAARFWWTRNDLDVTRFDWNGKTNRWEPLRGNTVKDIGVLTADGEYILMPRPTRFSVGSYLPGDVLVPDEYALVRVGLMADATATVPQVEVVDDVDVEDTYSFPGATPDAVVGVTNGIVQFNPAFIETYAGQTVWYNPEQFSTEATGDLGELKDAELTPPLLSPIPGPTDLPFVRFGSRRYLTAVSVADDATLALTVVASGSFAWSQTTGKLKFNATDVAQADPTDLSFDIRYLGCHVFYDGVSMTTASMSPKAPVQLVDSGGLPTTVGASNDLYVPLAVPLPSPGVSGVLHVPDETGTIPNLSATPGTRPNGSGLVRGVEGFGDLVLFGIGGVIEQVEVVEFESDMPTFSFQIPEGKAYIAREAGTGGSKIGLSRKDRVRLNGDPVYFLQAEVQPAVKPVTARIYARETGPYTLDGTEVLYFDIDGTLETWNASTLGDGTWSASDVATSIQAAIGGTGVATSVRDRVVLEAADPTNGVVEIGFGSTGAFADRDFSGAAVLGFLPGWRVGATGGSSDDWLPDNGATLGVFRSPQNRNRSETTPDFQVRGHYDNQVFAEDVMVSPAFPLTNPPLRDVAGFDDDVFFQSVDGLNLKWLRNFVDVLYQFDEGRFMWLEEGTTAHRIERASASLPFDDVGVVGDSLYPAVATNNGLYVSEDGSTYTLQTEGTDYLLPGDGAAGQSILISVVGGLVTSGAAGSFLQGGTTFTDLNATFITDGVTAGYRLRVLVGDAAGSYIVSSVTSETILEVAADVPFIADAGPASGEPYASWRLYEGFPTSVYDPAVVVDVQYQQFNHLSAETFKIRLLDGLGATPAPPAGRLFAQVTEAFQRGRTTAIRFGLASGSPEATLTALIQGTVLGVMANESLFLDVTDAHFTNQDFEIRVGSKAYTIGVDLTVVGAFTPVLPGDEIEVLSGTGQLKFGDAALANMEGSIVLYDQLYLTPASLAAGQAEYNPIDGGINLSAADVALYAGDAAYFVEQLITENRLDVAVSPMIGSFYLNRPLRSGQLVEAEYYQATNTGAQTGSLITEFLPLMVRLEVATRVSETVYTVNPTAKTIAARVSPMIWVDNHLQNYGNFEQVSFDNGQLLFDEPVDAAAVVQVNYGVLEAFGGEQAYNTSTTPVWRPPFFLEADQNTFTVTGDRTSEFPVGKLLRLGPTPFYIKGAAFAAGVTTVTVWPTPAVEAGSRAPGNDVLSLLTDGPVTDEVDGVPAGGSAGFLLTLSATYEPVSPGNLSMIFHGDVTSYTVPGHLLQVGGYPFIIVDGRLADDGMTTRVDVSSPFRRAAVSGTDAVKISARPIYPPTPRSFLGVYPLVETEDSELVLFGETEGAVALPGRTLTRGVHYGLNPGDGAVELIEPVQAALGAGQKLLLSYTRIRTLGPFLQDGAVIYPRYRSAYSHIVAPSEDNGLLGTTLLGTYTFRSPDAFYYRALPLEEYMGEVTELAVQRVQDQNPSGGPVQAMFGSTSNQDQGRLGLKSERRDLTDQDRAARTFIGFYNETIVSLEQILETMDGRVIGDRDGKFRFFIGYGNAYPPPGYEDEVTGDLNPRNIWSDVFLAANGSFGVSESDPIVDPETAAQDPLTFEVTGDPMNPYLLRYYMEEQVETVANDMDDRLLVGNSRPRMLPAFPFPLFRIFGDFKGMWESSRFSRLFPERTLAFTTTYPGLNADLVAGETGVYSFLKVLDPPATMKQEDEDTQVIGSTFGKPIGSVANPALGIIENVTDAQPRDRLPRARIWAYYPNGSADLDAALGTTTVGIATVVATPLYLKDFPIDPDTGFPDTTRFLSVNPAGGDLMDLGTGDSILSTPAFLPVDAIAATGKPQQVAFGAPTGETFSVGNGLLTIASLFDGGGAGVDIDPIFAGVFVGSVQAGCVITLSDENGTDLAGADVLRLGSGSLSGEPVALLEGDTIYVIPPRARDASEMENPPTVEDQFEFTQGIPTYRRSFDVGVQKRGGNFIDLSMPSLHDPSFPIQEMLGQKPPGPLSTLEADIEFIYNERTPFSFPALLGEPTNDSGDHTIPYLGTRNTELDRLGEVAAAFRKVFEDSTIAVLPADQLWRAIYPDEIVGDDGQVLGAATASDPPATLLTSRDLEPVGMGPYVANSGVGDVRTFDLLMIERPSTGTGLPIGSTGILSVGSVQAGELEPPRFVTMTVRGDTIRYTVTSAMAHLGGGGATGMSVTAVPSGPNWTTTFDISSVAGAPVFNDGAGAGVNGGLNNIFMGLGNAAVLRLYDGAGALVETIVLSDTACVGGAGSGVPVGPVAADEKTITVTTNTQFVTNTGTVYDFTLDVDTYITSDTSTASGGVLVVGSAMGSMTARVGRNRLSFTERLDLSAAVQRDTLTPAPGLLPVESGLSVWEITASGMPGITVNAPTTVNGGNAFTFLERTPGGGVGGFVAATGPGIGNELGTIKVMAFEGDNNTPIVTTSAFTFSAIPSSELDETDYICQGTGSIPDTDTWVENVTPTQGTVGQVKAGDILAVTASLTGDAAIKTGTYLVRHAVEESLATPGIREVTLTGMAGPSGAWAEVIFPTVVAFDDVALTVEVTDTSGVGPLGSAWTATGRLYVIPSAGNPLGIYSMAYTSIVANVFTLTPTSAWDAGGVIVPDADFFNAVDVGRNVTGMAYVPIGNWPSPLPSNSVVGFGHLASSVAGFRDVIICNSTFGDATTYQTHFSYGGGNDIVVGAPLSGDLGITLATAASPLSFHSDPDTVVYDYVAEYMDLTGITPTQWADIHEGGGITTFGVNAILPMDRLVTSTTVDASGVATGTPGFTATAGIFLEPSFPRPTKNLNQAVSHVVDASTTATGPGMVGVRNASTFGLIGGFEDVTFEVRRIRRFHEVLDNITENLTPLRFAYEIRTGTVLSGTATSLVADTTTWGTATQLGDFTEPDVNVNPGDTVRLFRAGTLVAQAEVGVLFSSSILILRAPGFAVIPIAGDTFEVYLRQAPVPHEQSNEELLDQVTDEVVLEGTANYGTGVGGYVSTVNELRDNTPGVAFSNVDVGDILLVDPAGELQGPGGVADPIEYGVRPVGDQSVPARGPGAPYIAGVPSELDDNRGYYRVVTAGTATEVEVTSISTFSGDAGAEVIFGAVGQEYAVLPTVTGPPAEGQQDLRVTAYANPATESFKGNAFSVAPFDYKIIRPSSLFSDEAVDLVLFMRERMLSWMEEIQTAVRGLKSGNYFIFQRDEHITDLGSPTDPDDGLGVMSNLFITSLRGLVDVSPYANVSDCLAVLDRRYWILDYRLDYEMPLGSGTPYSSFEADSPGVPPLVAGSGRPVQPDLIEDVLDRGDRFRQMRLAWIRFRTDRVNGTLPSIMRFDLELPRRVIEQEMLLRLKEGLDDV